MKKIFTSALFLTVGFAGWSQLELGCSTADSAHFSCFPGLESQGSQDNQMHIPSTHGYQVIIRQGDTYTINGGTVPGNNDFTAYIPQNGSSTKGYLSVNQENNPGGVTICEISYDSIARSWSLISSQAVDFSHDSIVKTERNCSGGITPWGTVVTAEESGNSADNNNDNYHDVGWLVEIDPATAQIIDHNNDGHPDKLFAMGKMAHENVAFSDDEVTAYFGADQSDGFVYKFVADNPQDFSSGTLYALQITGVTDLDNSVNPIPTAGTWVQVDNSSRTNRNNAIGLADAAGATDFEKVEDVEINPATGDIYFTSKDGGVPGGVYKFTDNGTSVSNFEVYVANNTDYTVEHAGGTQTNATLSSGCDNLTFDDKGNLYLLQDGGRDHIWFFRHDHTMASPKVSIFMRSPNGSEPTGMTFSPDYKFAFVSIQHPGSGNTQQDILGNTYDWNSSTTIVIARKEFLGTTLNPMLEVKENTTTINNNGTVDFGNVDISTNANKTLTVENNGADNLVVDYFVLAGDNEFTIANPGALMINAGSSINFDVTFDPSAAQTYNASIAFITNDSPNPYNVNLTGNGFSTVNIENYQAMDINVYPNPVVENLNIQSSKNGVATIIDASGRRVKNINIVEGMNTVSVSDLNTGVYFVQMTMGTQVLTTKVYVK